MSSLTDAQHGAEPPALPNSVAECAATPCRLSVYEHSLDGVIVASHESGHVIEAIHFRLADRLDLIIEMFRIDHDEICSHPWSDSTRVDAQEIRYVRGEFVDRLLGRHERTTREESGSNHPTGEEAIIEITDQPHTGCAKFSQRFGVEAHRFVNSEVGKELNLRGVNARLVVPSTIRPCDVIRKL